MPDPIKLPRKLRARGWKVKIYDNERLEPPHLTVICRERVWRVGLRDRDLLVPPGGRWRDLDAELRELLEQHWNTLCEAWDAKHPTNPVSSREEDDDAD